MRSYYKGTVRDEHGDVVVGAYISSFLAGTTTPAKIYTALTGGSAVYYVTSGSDGTFFLYVDSTDYTTTQLFKLIITYGTESTTYDYHTLFDTSDIVAIVTGAVVVTQNNVILTNADATQTSLDRLATAADRIQTGLDSDATAADVVLTGLDVIAAEHAQADAEIAQAAAEHAKSDAEAAAVISEDSASASAAIYTVVAEAQAQTNALLGLGIGSSYIDANGDLIMTYNAATITSLEINAIGELVVTY